MSLTFYDGYWYCYANSTAMLLSSIGEDISPHLIEPLTGVGLGAFISSGGLPFFSGLMGAPDVGISKALEILGFSFKEESSNKPDINMHDILSNVLSKDVAILGPLDMTYLVYNPKRPKYEGVDHFVLAYKLENDRVYVYDPAGYAKVSISIEDLTKAWKAEGISYKRGHFRYWYLPKRISKPTENEIYSNAMSFFKSLYTESDKLALKENKLNDDKAILEVSRLAKEKHLTESQVGFLTSFALPLGTKRAFDYSNFFKDFNDKLSKLKSEQSDLFGKAQTLATQKNWKKLSSILSEISEFEKRIKEEVLILK